MSLSKQLLEILACPQCKQPVKVNASEDGLVCGACRLEYPIRNDIPVMLIDEAKPLAS